MQFLEGQKVLGGGSGSIGNDYGLAHNEALAAMYDALEHAGTGHNGIIWNRES